MKRLVVIATVMVTLFAGAGCSSGHYVTVEPAPVRYSRPPRPYPNYIWIGDGYYWRGGRYMYRPGNWVRPRPGFHYRPGGWVNTPRGYYWRRGGWVR